MESSDDAGVNLFTIGPSTALGRALAFRILFCRSSRKLAHAICAKALWYVQRGRWATRVLAAAVSPRRPLLLLILLAMGFLYRRSRPQRLRADQAFRRKFWQNVMKSAVSYEEWAHAASMTERELPRRKDSDLYDEELVRAKLQELQRCRLEGGIEDTLFCLRADLVRNLGNMCNPELHQGRLQAPGLIQEYINEVRFQLRAVCDGDGEEVVSLGERIAFMRETRHGFGRTALLLSGGAALGSFHVGVVRALIQQRLLPRVLAGASVGSILCSFAATRTWPELHSFFDDPMPPMLFFDALGSVFATASRLLTRGAVHEIGVLQRQMRQLIGDLTFQEAYDLSGRVLGISVCSSRRHEPPRLLNYLTSPHVVIWSAVTASCAFPGLFEAQELMAKNRQGQLMPYHALSQVAPLLGGVMRPRAWRDGSLESDLPMLQLKELFNVNHFIVSQANPHIAPLLRMKEFFRTFGGHFAGKLAHLVEMEVKHRCNQVLEMGFRAYGLAKLFAQDWEGDVTIVMPATLTQFIRLIQNPTPSDIRKAAMQGRRCTWEKLSAIQANCGIELMLDECVSELNHKLNAKKKAHSSTLLGRLTSIKRIPSWNCLGRENSSCSSLDDDITDVVLQAGGPWGGPSLRKLRPVHNHDGSDSESSVETLDHNTTWTKAGGPLMRTSSSKKFILLYDSTINNPSGQIVMESLHSKDGSDDAEQLKTQHAKHEIMNNWEACTNPDMNKLNDNHGTSGHLTHTRLSHHKHRDDDTQFEDFSFPWETSLAKQSSSINESPSLLLIEGEQHVPYVGASLSGFKDKKEPEQNM